MSATRYMGGLVGMVNCPVNIYNCYTDCYLTGANLGGLIGGAGGRARINLQNFYTAGYGLAENRAAGWVGFEENVSPLKNATNGYSAMSLELTGDSDTEEADRRIYTTAYDCVNATRAYYLPLVNTTGLPQQPGRSHQLRGADGEGGPGKPTGPLRPGYLRPDLPL